MIPPITVLGRSIPPYGIMVAAGLAAMVIYLALVMRRRNIPPRRQGDIQIAATVGAIGCVVGAKLLFLLTILPQLAAALSESVREFARVAAGGGFVFYGGLYGWLLGVWLYARFAKCGFGGLMDVLAPAPVLFHAFGRIGCFLTGCCYGKPTDSLLGVVYRCSDAAPNGVPLIPVQLFEAAAEFILFGIMAALAGRKSGVWRMRFHLLAYAVFRFIIEFFRGDALRGFVGPLSTSQVIALASIAVVTLSILLPRRGAGQTGAAA